MNNKLAQIIALITYGNEYLTSFRYDVLELFKSHSTFQYVSEVSFYGKTLKYGFDWEKWFAEALELLNSPSAIPPYYADLLPASFENKKCRQLLAGALIGWVFGGLGSWNDMYFREHSLEREYQLVSKNLYRAVIQSIGAVANFTSICQLAEIT